jgi:poly(ADP-ribose) glycohydrolase ARH3
VASLAAPRWAKQRHAYPRSVSEQRLDRARGALLGTFTGDALGMAFEGAPPQAVCEAPEMREARLGRGTYTDDTAMMIALAESLLACGGVDEHHLGSAFVRAYDPRRGYGTGTRSVLAMISSGTAPIEAAKQAFAGRGSLGNGAAMRVAPVAVMYSQDPEALIDAARRSAHTTHAHPIGVDAAIVQACATGAALRGADPLAAATAAAATTELRGGLETLARVLAKRPAPATVSEVLGNGSAGHESVPAALYAAVSQPDFEKSVSFAVRCGGDTDTIAAMAGAIAGARHGARAIPTRWLAALENAERGRSYTETLAEQLAFY